MAGQSIVRVAISTPELSDNLTRGVSSLVESGWRWQVTKPTATTKKTGTSTTNQPAAATTSAPSSQTTTGQAEATQASVTGIKFAKPKAEKAKSDRPYCDHVNGKGERCQLRVLDGRTRCVNHVPAEERLTQDEAQALLTLVGGLDEAQQVRMLTRAIGWFKVKQMVGGKPEGDMVLNELVG